MYKPGDLFVDVDYNNVSRFWLILDADEFTISYRYMPSPTYEHEDKLISYPIICSSFRKRK